MTMSHEEAATKLRDAARRLSAKSLLRDGDSLSMRLAGTGQVLLLTATRNEPHIDAVPLAEGASGNDAPGASPSQHLVVYRSRPDVGCVVLNRQQWAASLHAFGEDMPGVFDEQVRHLGRSVGVLDESIATPDGLRRLRSGANAFVLPGQVLCLGMVLERAIFNAELLEKCAKAYVLASCTGLPVGRIPWLVRWIANGRLMKDERRAATKYATGQTPELSTAY
jgi:ribulose-5-phosphate 4-epimerase/fuculose-1-phosphate aldolase